MSSAVTDTIVWKIKPVNRVVLVNSTAFLPCQAVFNYQYDLIYTWKFNGRNINFDLQHNYVQVKTRFYS